MTYKEVRTAFVDFFKSKQHTPVASSPLVPLDDPTLLFTNAGMNQFKDIFLGNRTVGYSRAVSVQKCVRAGGKHNDLDNVGYTTRHHTFFEMLGNFSFGDYFKEEAIEMGWSFLTETLGLPKNKLHVTVFETDDEAAEIWEKKIGVPKDRILRFGEKDNFWRMGETGPCGPCSEIFYDHGEAAAKDPSLPFGLDEDRFVEVWNLVFMQYFEDENKTLTPLPKPSVDTGAGLERLAAVMQGQADNYYTDAFMPLIEHICAQTKTPVEKWDATPESRAAHKVVADHARSTVFLMADGIKPGNDGRAYVLRRIMRRALRYAQKLSPEKQLFESVCAKVIEIYSEAYPELKPELLKPIHQETEKFLATLQQGTKMLHEHIEELKAAGKKELDGATAFKLYDTFGFPVDLTQIMSEEQGLKLNMKDFETHLAKAKDVAKKNQKVHQIDADDKAISDWAQGLKETVFVGYDRTEHKSTLQQTHSGKAASTSLSEGDTGFVVLAETPFYAEGGGQQGDRGHLQWSGGSAEVFNCEQRCNTYLHEVKVLKGELKQDQEIEAHVSLSHRRATEKNHSATHLLHQALKTVVGDHVGQAGSLVTHEKLRFDFSHDKALSQEELQQVEQLVNQQIFMGHGVTSQTQTYDDAVNEGAIAMFGEKYESDVRVITMGPFSKELCGGTHVRNTSEIGLLKIVSESSISSGVRRMEALTGSMAFAYLNKNALENMEARHHLNLSAKWETYLHERKVTVTEWIEKTQQQFQQMQKEVQALKAKSISVKDLLQKGETITISDGPQCLFVVEQLDTEDRQLLSQVMDQLKSSHQDVVAVLVGQGQPSPILIGATKNLPVHCGNLLKEVSKKYSGKGGGRPDFAQGSLGNVDLKGLKNSVSEQL